MFMPPKKAHLTDAGLEEINNSKAVKAIRDKEKHKEAEEAGRLEKEDKVNSQITIWKAGKEKNLRALLSSLDMILWSDVQWKNVTMLDLNESRKCKITYMKAIAQVHPDKLPATATVDS
ncbi:DnaJ domain-containing protein, partial [Mycotypha africana]|uniref:DnaJ domain-containing protein n=1 Tax=Mycotypha africana TaxID=64632 RepID=UPI002301C8EF